MSIVLLKVMLKVIVLFIRNIKVELDPGHQSTSEMELFVKKAFVPKDILDVGRNAGHTSDG